MDRDKLERYKRHVRNPNFIAGIHNYCDRWCERCPMTARCSIYEPQKAGARAASDPGGEAFLEKIRETFEMTAALLQEMAEEAGIDLEALAEAADDDPEENAEADHHILVLAAAKYEDAVRDWFDRWPQLAGPPGIGAGDPKPDLREAGSSPSPAAAGDLVETVHWYRPLIQAKLYRAVQPDPLEALEGMQDVPRDADGSAKVALIAMDRSAAAWTGLIAAVPQAKTEILDLVARLDRLRRATEFAFPRARAFVRPGFDDAPAGTSSET